MDSIEERVSRLEHHEMHEHCNEEKENDMDIAALMAMMNNNKNMDLPGLLALCKEQGGNEGGFGGNGAMWLILILILFMGNNGGGLFGNNRAAAAEAVGGVENLQIITSLYDRLASNQAATTAGFASQQTALCSSIAEVVGAVNNQGDRLYDATRNVGDAVRDCCCQMNAAITALGCKVEAVNSNVNLTRESINSRIALSEERNLNGQEKIMSAIALSEKNIICHVDTMAKDNIIREQAAKLQAFEAAAIARETSTNAVNNLENFIVRHYAPTNTCGCVAA